MLEKILHTWFIDKYGLICLWLYLQSVFIVYELVLFSNYFYHTCINCRTLWFSQKREREKTIERRREKNTINKQSIITQKQKTYKLEQPKHNKIQEIICN